MFLIIISIILCIGLFVFLGICDVTTQDSYGYRRQEKIFKINKKQILSLLPLLLIIINFFTVVPANNVGILYSPFTGVRQETISEGLKAKGIFDRVYKISTEVQTVTLEHLTTQTADGQWLDAKVDIKYKVDESTAFHVFKQYRDLDRVANSLISPTVQRSIEEISTKYNVIDILGEKRSDLYKGIEQELKDRLATNGITFVSINFIDMDAGDAIEKAIQDEAIAKKAVETAEQARLKSEIEAQKRVVEAEADKQKAVIEAETKLIQAKADADANKLITESLTPQLIELKIAEARLVHGWVTVQSGSVLTDIRE